MSQFKIGDEVTWASQSAGRTKTKTGRVVEIVLPGSVPRLKGHGGKRDHTSYLVRASGRLYWPRVSHLALTQVVLHEKLGGIISDGTTGATCRTCKQDLANPGQLLRCREHHVSEIAKQSEIVKTLEGKITSLMAKSTEAMKTENVCVLHDGGTAEGCAGCFGSMFEKVEQLTVALRDIAHRDDRSQDNYMSEFECRQVARRALGEKT